LGKAESMIFDPKCRLQKISLEDFKISCNGINIEAKSSVKYLEIMIDQFLSVVLNKVKVNRLFISERSLQDK
jgi:hypothetical protein